MTEQEKIDWLAKATPEKLIEQLRWTVTIIANAETFAARYDAQQDYELITAEMLKRMK